MNGLNGTDAFDPRIAWREGFESIDAATLLDKPLPKSKFLVDGLIPQGVHLISGSAKIGKSWLMLDLALKLAAGEPFWGMETVKCGVLYLSLEDTLARIQSRLMKLTDEAPSNLRFAVTAGTIGNGLDTEIGSYLHTYPDTKLIIIENGVVSEFAMNDKCSAGTGRFLEVMANTLSVTLAELCRMAEQGSATRISSLCTVFAESEVINLIGRGTPRENIAWAVIDSIAQKVKTQAVKVTPGDGPLYLTGGLCDFPFVCERLEKAFGREVFTLPEARFAGALGAAIFASAL